MTPEDTAVAVCALVGIEPSSANVQRVLDLRRLRGPSYRDSPGLVNRANSALITIERIAADRSIPSEIRLVLIAQRMAQEPVLTDDSTAAARARRDAARWHARRVVQG